MSDTLVNLASVARRLEQAEEDLADLRLQRSAWVAMALAEGHPKATIARLCGVSRQLVHRWADLERI